MSGDAPEIPEYTIDNGVHNEEAGQSRPHSIRSPTRWITDTEVTKNETPLSGFRNPQRTATMDSQFWHESEKLVEAKLLSEAESDHSINFTKHERSSTVDVGKLKDLQKHFNSRYQFKKLLVDGLCRWAVTALLILFLYVILFHYAGKAVMSNAKKLQFNALVTGLSIGLGLSIASSLKEMALELRWWILSRRKRSLYEVDRILHLDSPTNVLKLAVARPRPMIILTVIFWLVLNLGAQIGVALLGLTYSVDSASNSALIIPGNVSIPDLKELATEHIVSSTDSKSDSALQYTANSFGTLALSLGYGDISDMPAPRTLSSAVSSLMFLGPDYTQYLYYDSSPDYPDNPNGIQVATNRTSNTTGICDSFPVNEGGNGSSYNISYLTNSSGEEDYAYIPLAGGLNQRTFVTLLSNTCGESCRRVYALEASATNAYFYDCNVTVGRVENTTREEHQLGIDLRDLAANAISLQGYAASSVTEDPDLQYQSYPAESIYGSPQNGSASSMGLLMAQFAIGVVAVAAQNNPSVIVPGDQPVAGVTLSINNWKYVHLILGLTGGVQLVLFLLTTFIANRVIVKDKSYLAISKLLAPTVQKVGSTGSLATGREISDVFGDEEKFIYTVDQASQGGLLRLALGQQKSHTGFSEGTYE